MGQANNASHSITGIELDDGSSGIFYSFGNELYPFELLSKDLLLSTPLTPTVPEPGTWLLSLITLGFIGFWRFKSRST
jgi:hypothetical protein